MPDIQKPHIYLLSEVNVAEPTGDGKTMPRKFSGVANSGKPFSHFGQRTIVDMDELEYHPKVPALIEHDRAQRAGFGALSVDSNSQLIINGTLLDNEFGATVASDADAGFPWQMSAHVIAGGIDELAEGQTETVNGQSITGPILVLRRCKIPEVSFTPTGVDSDTSAVVLSDNLKQYVTLSDSNIPNKPKDDTMTLEEALARIAAQDKEITDLKTENDALKAQNKELLDEKAELEKAKHEADVEAQLSQAGFKKSEDGTTWQGISAGTVNVLLSSSIEHAKDLIADLKPSGGQDAPGYLFGEQHAPPAGTQDVKLSNNPLVAAAAARSNNDQKTYI